MTVQLKNLSGADAGIVERPLNAAIARRPGLYNRVFKRAVDILLVFLSVPIALPLIAFVALVIAKDGKSPFYTQLRVGRNGTHFKMLKIRTMVKDAEQLLDAHLDENPNAREEWDRDQKLKDDPRILPFGQFLRKSSIDELPQLWNVLRGDMSLVGPRPMMVPQKEIYPGTVYFEMRPGITGLWQISDRNDTTFAERALFDRAYYNSLSLKTDLSILARTVAVVIRCTGY